MAEDASEFLEGQQMGFKCGICVSGFPVTGSMEGYVSCIRPEGHAGPHLVVNEAGRVYCWEPDPESDDPDDFIYWVPDIDEARQMVSTPREANA